MCFRLSPIALVLGVLLQPRSIRDGGNRQVMGRCASHLPIDSTTHKKKYLTPININPPTSLSALRQNQSLRCRNASASSVFEFLSRPVRRALHAARALWKSGNDGTIGVPRVQRTCSIDPPSISRTCRLAVLTRKERLHTPAFNLPDPER